MSDLNNSFENLKKQVDTLNAMRINWRFERIAMQIKEDAMMYIALSLCICVVSFVFFTIFEGRIATTFPEFFLERQENSDNLFNESFSDTRYESNMLSYEVKEFLRKDNIEEIKIRCDGFPTKTSFKTDSGHNFYSDEYCRLPFKFAVAKKKDGKFIFYFDKSLKQNYFSQHLFSVINEHIQEARFEVNKSITINQSW